MSKAVLFSIKPKYCELIASGKKTIEVRKTKPKLDMPFKCYGYCTKGEFLTRSHNNGKIYVAYSPKYQKALERNGNITLSGKVIGEFVCKCISEWHIDPQTKGYFITSEELTATCLTYEQLHEYGNGKTLYGFHISDLVIYDNPKELKEFSSGSSKLEFNNTEDGFPWKWSGTKRPPQSWYYVEELI